ncbi:ABC transporter permease [Tunicatimonas pelagia]|uniref:ABC transporter permease n=1 Tax=Tunicatimonas pelagia TaxID=931531 RepID=UPI0026664C09|nr:ABC transporter permease [Tunicatimonas pelagia]WKN41480.1 ABC transporter permease [Tunicatimonas pelagia]
MKRPPHAATIFLRWYCRSELLDEVEGDLYELFQRRVETKGLQRAQLRYWLNVLMFFHPDYIRKRKYYPTNHTAMLRNYFHITFRQLQKHKAFSVINLSGLALGMAAFILILEYVGYQQSFNRFHTQLPNLYRVLFQKEGQPSMEVISPGVAAFSQENFPEVADFCRLAQGVARGTVTYYDDSLGQYLQSHLEAEPIAYADGSFFRMFSFPVLQGSPNALQSPNTIALSQSYAQKYFGDQEPIGKVLTLNNMFGNTAYTVGIVYQDMPENSDIRYDMLFSLQTLANPANRNGNDWARLDNVDAQYVYTYLLLQDGTDPKALQGQLTDYKMTLQPDDEDLIRLQPFRYVHLAQSLGDADPTFGKLPFVYMLSGIALLILLIAWLNYINLSTAGAMKRAKEVGVRKVVGARRKQLIGQFLGESFLLNSLAFGLALLLVMLVQDYFNQLTGQTLSLASLAPQHDWMLGVLLLLAGSVASGSYTAFVLSSFKPLRVLKGALGQAGKGVLLRRVLVVFQFSVSVILMIGTLVLFRQLQFMQNRDLHMDMEQLLTFYAPSVGKDDSFAQRTASFQNELEQLSFVQNYTNSGSVPGMYYNFSTSGVTSLHPAPEDEKKVYDFLNIDHRYLDTYDITLIAGKNFTPQMCESPPDQVDQVMVNEKAALELGFASAQEAIGQKILYGREREIIGVVHDYNHQSLKKAITPMIFMPRNNGVFFTVRLTTDQLPAKVSELEQRFEEYFPGNPFEFFFADERYNQQYQAEQQYQQVFTAASGLAIFIACLGLFGLATFTAQQRVKEISIRKVLGASVSSIVRLVSKDFLWLIMIANLFAWPLAWWAARHWLQDFAYQAELGWWIFVLASGAALLIAIATISFQSIKAALANPVDSLRNE